MSLAQPAIDLCHRAGRILDPWQQDALRIMLAIHPDGKWACFEYGEIVPRQNGKGGILEARVLAGLFLFDEELLMWSAHEYKTAMEGFRRVLALLRKLGRQVNENLYIVDDSPVKVINTNGEEGMERLDTGQRLKFVARSKSSGRGFSGDVNIIDETFAYTREQQEALMPTMAARENPQIIYTSSPPLTTGTGEIMFALRARAEGESDDEDDALGWRDWGHDGDLDDLKEIDIEDRELWKRHNPGWGYRITERFVRKERKGMSAVGFARERLGIWPRAPIGGGWRVISKDRWEDRKDPDSSLTDPIALAIDVSPTRSHTAIASAGRRPDGDRHIELAVHAEGTSWVVKRIKSICSRRPVCAVVVDGAGPAASLLVDLERELETLKVPVPIHKLGAQEAAAAFGAFYDGFVPASEQPSGELGEDATDVDATDIAAEADDPDADPVAADSTAIWHLDQPALSVALAGALKRKLSGGHAWDRTGVEIDLTPLVAVTSALFGYSKYGHLVAETTPPPATAPAPLPQDTNLWRPKQRLKI